MLVAASANEPAVLTLVWALCYIPHNMPVHLVSFVPLHVTDLAIQFKMTCNMLTPHAYSITLHHNPHPVLQSSLCPFVVLTLFVEAH
jgi:hypothetical protein